jgi:hypothetical protein
METHRSFSSSRSTATSTSGGDLAAENKMVFSYVIREGEAALESERVVLVFADLSPTQQKLFHFQGDRQTVQVGGEGFSSISRTFATHRGAVGFHSNYEHGTNTLKFGKQTVQFINGGNTLLAENMTFDLGAGRKTVYLKRGVAKAE